MIYEDFSVKIEPKQGDMYPVIVLRSPAGEGRSLFTLPFDPSTVSEMIVDLGQTVRVTYTAGRSESWSPVAGADGSLYFTSNRDGTADIYRLDLAGQVVQVSNTPGGAGSWTDRDP